MIAISRWLRAGVLLAMCLGVVASAAAQGMMNPKDVSGIPLPVADVPGGTVTVRVVRGTMANNLTGVTIELVINGKARQMTTDATGRVQVSDLAAGTRLKATAIVDGKRIESQDITVGASGLRVLLAADSHSGVIESALAPLAESEGGRYRIDLVKLSHHGSAHNTSPEIPKRIDCTRFAISTDGSRRHKHPHGQSIARVLAADPDRNKVLYFNYRQPQTELWESRRLTRRWHYECEFPTASADDPRNGTLTIEI